MKEATNLTPIEIIEENLYNIIIIGSISGAITSLLLILYILITTSFFSYLFLILFTSFSLVGYLVINFKQKRFGKRNRSLAERLVEVEQKIDILSKSTFITEGEICEN